MTSKSVEWARANKARQKANNYNYRLRKRAMVLSHYGGRCACCGEDDFHFLTIDHIDRQVPDTHVHAEGKHAGTRKYGDILISQIIRDRMPEGLQALCWNCNSTIGALGFCPHQATEEDVLRFDPYGKPIEVKLPRSNYSLASIQRERAKKGLGPKP
jgi:hypothetical protein